jgi:D-alanyl-D-alanine carboxypeptidase (penicillin-binding protein 5/6)
MDRRKFVYYNQRTNRPMLQARKKPKNNRSKIILAIFFVAFFGIFSLGLKSDNNEAGQVLADQTIETQQQEEVKIDSPLQNVTLPEVGQTAIGTLDQGVIKHTDSETQAPIASITKVITALVLLEKRPLQLGEKGDTITLNEKDFQYFNDYYAKLGTVTAVAVGESMSQYEALEAILLPSSNNMSDTMIDRYFASMEDYLTYANDYLRRNGLDNTVVADASGFSPGSKSTPSDLIKLGQLALQNPIIKEIVAKPFTTISVGGDIPNYNQLINEPNIIGIKPGTTDEAGYCLLFAANLPDAAGNTVTVITATIGHPDRPQYIETILKLHNDARQVLLTPSF